MFKNLKIMFVVCHRPTKLGISKKTTLTTDTQVKRHINLAFWPLSPWGLCAHRTHSQPVWPVCICISAAPPDTPLNLHLDKGKSCRLFLAPTRGGEDSYNITLEKQKNTINMTLPISTHSHCYNKLSLCDLKWLTINFMRKSY